MNSGLRCIIITLLLILSPSWIEAQEYKYHNGTMILPYKELKFNQDAEGSSALVIYLHPRSARGHKNETQERVLAYKHLVEYLSTNTMKAVLLAPQCEEARHWNEYSSPLGKYLSDVVKDFIDDYVSHNAIDKGRIYILGESFGASGTWRLVSDYPDYFAAAMPAICSPKLDRLTHFVNLKKCAKTPLCLVAGEKDEVYGPQVMEPYVKVLQKRKCDLKYIILPGLNHYKSCGNPFPKEGLDWLFSHKK
ncbi:MAG: hypothetical protein MJZ20_06130 [Bacteroidaceae bacterium]|nr:hypothetical protein [Bacteroidaceae bacterium]